MFATENPILGASAAVAGPLTLMLANNIAEVSVEGLDVTVNASETPRSVSIERVWLDDIRPRAGPHGAAEGADPFVSRRGEDLDAAD